MRRPRMQDLGEEMRLEQTDWARLRTLEHPRRLDSRTRHFKWNITLQDARYRDWRLALVTSQLFTMANSVEFLRHAQQYPGLGVGLPADDYVASTGQSRQRLAVWGAMTSP